MRIRMFSLCAERDLAQRKLEAKIADALHGFASNTLEFEDFSAPQEMLAPLAQSLKNEEMTVVAVEKKAYNKIKKKLLPAMGYELERNGDIYASLDGMENLDDAKREAHSLFPKDATVFESEDKLYSGLGINKNGRLFVMLPLDKNRVPDMLKSKVLPYLIVNKPVTPAAPKEEKPVGKKESKSVSSNPLVRSINLLKEANTRVAFCANKQQDIIGLLLSELSVGNDMFLFSPHVEDRGDIDVVSYSVQLARAAKNLSHTELGAVISDPFDDENGRGVCISITDGEKAIARRFYAQEGESDDSLVRAAAEETITLLGQNAYGVLEDNSVTPEAPEMEKIAEKRTVKRIFIILAAVLALCIAAGVAFKILSDRRNKEPETTEPSTSATTTTTEPTTEKVETVNLMKSVVDTLLSRGENDKVAAKKDDKAPEKFMKNGEEVDAKETLALIVQNNIDDNDDWNAEALKAQVVAIFTCLKYRNNGFDVSDVELANTADAKVKDAVNAVYGDYLTYKDEVIAALFHRSSAGRTATAQTVYGKEIPYLVSVNVATDARQNDNENEVRIDTTTFRNLVYKATGSGSLSDTDPAGWIKITKHDGAVDKNTGYVIEISAGDMVLSGYDYVQKIDKNSPTPLASLCFKVSYDEKAKEYIFTTYGMGSGVGMSQRGAIAMGKASSYEDILKAFYPDTELQKGEASQATTEESTTQAPRTTRYSGGGTRTTAPRTTAPTTTAAPTTTTTTKAPEPTGTTAPSTSEATTEADTDYPDLTD